jgi:hypothetical protein
VSIKFGLTWNAALETGGISRKILVSEIQFVKTINSREILRYYVCGIFI